VLGSCDRRRGIGKRDYAIVLLLARLGLRAGEVGQVLRHQLPATTEIYAKVDFNALRTLALPWQGGAL